MRRPQPLELRHPVGVEGERPPALQPSVLLAVLVDVRRAAEGGVRTPDEDGSALVQEEEEADAGTAGGDVG